MCGGDPLEVVRALREQVAQLRQHKELLEEQLSSTRRRVDLLEVNITELWHRAVAPAPLNSYLDIPEDSFSAWVEDRAGA